MTHYQIKNRWTDAVLFEGDFGTMRLCVEAAVKNLANLARADLAGAYLAGADLAGADLAGADLAGANLDRANLSGADLAGANMSGVKLRGLSKTCSRSDGYQFLLWDCEDGQWRITAGCRFFTLEQAWKHWTRTRDNTPLGEETFDILVMFEHHAERVEAAR